MYAEKFFLMVTMMNKKKMKRGIVLAIVFFVICSVPLSFDFTSEHGDAVTPVRYDEKTRTYLPLGGGDGRFEESIILDLSQKNLLTPTKYGFRKKIKADKPIRERMSLNANIHTPTPYNGLKYGIYRDKHLNEPIDEINIQREIRKERKSEYITSTDFRGIIEKELEPGEYYIAVYTTHYWDSFKIELTNHYEEL